MTIIILQNDQSKPLQSLLHYKIHLHIFIKIKKWQKNTGIMSLSWTVVVQVTVKQFATILCVIFEWFIIPIMNVTLDFHYGQMGYT